jgi:hypothetical protein
MHQFPSYTPAHDGQPPRSEGKGLSITWQNGPFIDTFGPNGSMPEQPVRALIHRIEDLQTTMPCDQNPEIIRHLNAILGLFDERTRDRNKRGVLGTAVP